MQRIHFIDIDNLRDRKQGKEQNLKSLLTKYIFARYLKYARKTLLLHVALLDKYCSKLDAKIDKVMGQYLI